MKSSTVREWPLVVFAVIHVPKPCVVLISIIWDTCHGFVCVELCLLRNKPLSRERKQPTFFLFVHSCKLGRREGASTCRRGWRVFPVTKLLALSSLPVARTRKSVMSATRPSANAVCPVEHAIVMNKRSKVTTSHPEELFEELYIDPVIHEVLLIPSGKRPERNTLINFVFFRALSEFLSPIREAFRAGLRCVHRELTERVIIVIAIVRLDHDFQ